MEQKLTEDIPLAVTHVQDVEINILVEDNPPSVIDVETIEIHEVDAGKIIAPSGEATGAEEKVKDVVDQKEEEKD